MQNLQTDGWDHCCYISLLDTDRGFKKGRKQTHNINTTQNETNGLSVTPIYTRMDKNNSGLRPLSICMSW